MSEDTSMGDSRDINTAILERLEKVVESLQENSIQMGKLLAVHNEKLEKQDRIDAVLFEKVESLHREVNRSTMDIKKGCERDIKMIDERLRLMEKKMWSIAGAIAIISFLVSPVGQRMLRPFTESSQLRLTPIVPSAIMGSVEMPLIELS